MQHRRPGSLCRALVATALTEARRSVALPGVAVTTALTAPRGHSSCLPCHRRMTWETIRWPTLLAASWDARIIIKLATLFSNHCFKGTKLALCGISESTLCTVPAQLDPCKQ